MSLRVGYLVDSGGLEESVGLQFLLRHLDPREGAEQLLQVQEETLGLQRDPGLEGSRLQLTMGERENQTLFTKRFFSKSGNIK